MKLPLIICSVFSVSFVGLLNVNHIGGPYRWLYLGIFRLFNINKGFLINYRILGFKLKGDMEGSNDILTSSPLITSKLN